MHYCNTQYTIQLALIGLRLQSAKNVVFIVMSLLLLLLMISGQVEIYLHSMNPFNYHFGWFFTAQHNKTLHTSIAIISLIFFICFEIKVFVSTILLSIIENKRRSNYTVFDIMTLLRGRHSIHLPYFFRF